jgi:PHD/YefM family antitoxin component YafN of YafNO toxin-antitoxin module
MVYQLPPQVLPTTEARARLSQIVADFARRGAAAEPVAFGSHRKPQGVIVPWELWAELAPALEDLLDATEARHRLAEAGEARSDFDHAAAALGRDATQYR